MTTCKVTHFTAVSPNKGKVLCQSFMFNYKILPFRFYSAKLNHKMDKIKVFKNNINKNCASQQTIIITIT